MDLDNERIMEFIPGRAELEVEIRGENTRDNVDHLTVQLEAHDLLVLSSDISYTAISPIYYNVRINAIARNPDKLDIQTLIYDLTRRGYTISVQHRRTMHKIYEWGASPRDPEYREEKFEGSED